MARLSEMSCTACRRGEPQVSAEEMAELRPQVPDLVPIVCVGETLDQRRAGDAEIIVRRQLEGSLAGVELSKADALVVAYEPVWAIGTAGDGDARAGAADARRIRKVLRQRLGAAGAEIGSSTAAASSPAMPRRSSPSPT